MDSIINGFKNTELGVFPKDWDVVELGNVLNEVDLIAEQIPDYNNLTILSLTKNFGLIPQSERFDHRVAIKDVRKYKVVKKNWIAYNPYVIWEGAIHSLRNRDIGLVSPVYVIWQCSSVDARYLDLILRTNLLLRQYEKYAAGAVNRRKSIKKNDFKIILIPLPPLPEQKKIAGVLSAVQEAKEKTGEVIKAAKELKKSLMKHLFTYGPVLIEEAEKVKLKETEIGMIPEDWKVIEVGKTGEVITGKTPPTAKIEYYGGPYKFITPGDMGESKHVKETQKYLSEEGINISRALPKESVLVVCIGATIGKTAMTLDEKDTTNQQINAIIPHNCFISHFLYYVISFRSSILPLMAGCAAIPIVNKNNFKKFKIATPSLPVQQEIANILSNIDNKIEVEENKKKAFEELFKTLLNNLMTGKIRVHHLDIEV